MEYVNIIFLQIFQWVCQRKNFENRLTLGKLSARIRCLVFLARGVQYYSTILLSVIRSLDLAIFRFFMKLFQTNNREIINDCCYFLISNRQVNACITAKADLIGYTISLEVLTLTRCVNCRFALHHTTQIRSAR